MTLSQLKYVLLLAEEKSFVKAARAAKVTQPTLSMQVSKLEQDLGVLLFDRSNKPLSPTSIGEKVIAHARAIFNEVEAINVITSTQEGIVRGTLRLGVIPTLAPYLLHRFLSSFAEDNKKLKLDVKELQTEEILQKLYANELDAGLLATPIETHGLKSEVLFYEPFYVYSSQEHTLANKKKIKAEQLDPSEMWTLEQGHCLRNQSLSICENNNKKKDRLRAFLKGGSLETLLRLVEQGKGYTIVPGLALDSIKDGKNAVIRPFSKPRPSREISLLYPTSAVNTMALEALSASIKESLTKTVVELNNSQLDVIPI